MFTRSTHMSDCSQIWILASVCENIEGSHLSPELAHPTPVPAETWGFPRSCWGRRGPCVHLQTPGMAALPDPASQGRWPPRRLLAAVISMQREPTAAGCTPTTTSGSSATGFLSLPCLPPPPGPSPSHKGGSPGLGLGRGLTWDSGGPSQVLAATNLLCDLEQVTSPCGPQFCHLLSEGIGLHPL